MALRELQIHRVIPYAIEIARILLPLHMVTTKRDQVALQNIATNYLDEIPHLQVRDKVMEHHFGVERAYNLTICGEEKSVLVRIIGSSRVGRPFLANRFYDEIWLDAKIQSQPIIGAWQKHNILRVSCVSVGEMLIMHMYYNDEQHMYDMYDFNLNLNLSRMLGAIDDNDSEDNDSEDNIAHSVPIMSSVYKSSS